MNEKLKKEINTEDIFEKIQNSIREGKSKKILWKKHFLYFLLSEGFSVNSIRSLYRWNIGENWRELKVDDHEVYFSGNPFDCDFHYILDRTTYDRLFRVHFKYCQTYRYL